MGAAPTTCRRGQAGQMRAPPTTCRRVRRATRGRPYDVQASQAGHKGRPYDVGESGRPDAGCRDWGSGGRE